jgi:biopolymer transport protein ExbD
MEGSAEASDDEGQRLGRNIFGEESAAAVTLNLTALMDILSNLLFFLLACFGTTIVMGINATVPLQSPHDSSLADTKQSVTAHVSVEKDGLDVTLVGSAQTPEELDRWHKTISVRDGTYDYRAFTATLLSIKKTYPRSDTMILTPEAGITYETMVATMDAARETEVTLSGSIRRLSLFPTVVISTVVK